MCPKKIDLQDFILAESKLLRELVERSEKLLQVYSAERLAQSPKEGAWSAGQVYQHINLTNSYYYHRLLKHLHQPGTKVSAPKTVQFSFVARMLIDFVDPHSGRMDYKIPTFGFLKPDKASDSGDKGSPVQAMEQFIEESLDLKEKLELLPQADLSRKTIKTFAPFVKINIPEALRYINRHTLRHIEQAERAMSSLESS